MQEEANLSHLYRDHSDPAKSCWSQFMDSVTAVCTKPSLEEMLENRNMTKSVTTRRRFKSMVRIFGDDENRGKLFSLPLSRFSASPKAKKVDGTKDMINISKLVKVIKKMQNDSNPLNILQSRYGASMRGRKERLFEVLDELEEKCSNPGFMSMDEHSKFINGDYPEDSAEAKVVEYMRRVAVGKKLFHWPPPLFIIFLTILQTVFFIISENVPPEDFKDVLQFDT